MKKGFGFLKTRNETKKINFDFFSKNYNLDFPILYRVFCNSFELGEDAFSLDTFYNQDKELESRIESIVYKPHKTHGHETLGIDFFINPNTSILLWENGLKNEKEWKELGLMKIGVFANPGYSIYLGMKQNNYDEIWRVASNWNGLGNYCTKISDNIFEFVRDFESAFIQYNITDVDLNRLYKKWGDTSWKIDN